MIFSMQDKFDENDIFWSRYNGGWMKTVTGLDKSVKNGYSLIGEFVDAGRTKNDYEAGLYINCNIDGSRKNQHKIVQLIKLSEDGEITLLKEIKDGGRTWAVEFWELIEENLTEEVKMSVNEIHNIIRKNLDEKQIEELLKKLGKTENTPIKVSVSDFSQVERIDEQLKKVIEDCDFQFDRMTYKEKSEVLGLTILKMWEKVFQFRRDEDVDLVFIKSEHIRKGEVDGYKLYTTESVDGFAKVEDGKISLRLLY